MQFKNIPSRVSEWIKKNPVSTLIFIFCTAVFILENMHGRLWMNDFRVYYSAAEELLKGNEIYGKPFGLESGNYKYSPFVAIVFVPFALLPYSIAKTILFFSTTIASVLLFKQLSAFLKSRYESLSTRNINIILLIVFVSSVAHLFRELHLGNVNMILLFILFSAMFALEKNEPKAGVLIAFCMLVKPHFIILLPLFFLRKKFKTLISFFVVMITGLLLPAIFTGWQKNQHLLSEWIATMRLHSTVIENAHQTLAFIIQNNFFHNTTPETFTQIVIASVVLFALVMLGFLLIHFREEKKSGQLVSKQNIQSEYFVLLAIIPSLTITDTEHFLFSIPVISLLVMNAFVMTKRKWIYVSVLCISLLLYGCNIHDLLGSKLSEKIFSAGILGMANVILVVLFLFTQQENSIQKA